MNCLISVEWINTGAYVERVNFAGRILNDPNKSGVRDIIDRIKTYSSSGSITTDRLAEVAFDVLGPMDVMETTKSGLKNYLSKYGDLSWEHDDESDNFDKAAVAAIQLIVSSQEYQTV